MNSSPSSPEWPEDRPEPVAEEPESAPFLKKLNPLGLLAGGASAATISVIGGYMGAVGTVAGAFLTSVISAAVLAVYTDSLEKGKKALTKVGESAKGVSRTAPHGSSSVPGHGPDEHSAAEQHDEGSSRSSTARIPRIAGLALLIGLIAVAGVFGVQRLLGTELSPGTGTIQRSVTGTDSVAPRGESGTDQQQDSDDDGGGRGGDTEQDGSENPDQQQDGGQDSDPGQQDDGGGSGGDSGGEGGGDSGGDTGSSSVGGGADQAPAASGSKATG